MANAAAAEGAAAGAEEQQWAQRLEALQHRYKGGRLRALHILHAVKIVRPRSQLKDMPLHRAVEYVKRVVAAVPGEASQAALGSKIVRIIEDSIKTDVDEEMLERDRYAKINETEKPLILRDLKMCQRFGLRVNAVVSGRLPGGRGVKCYDSHILIRRLWKSCRGERARCGVDWRFEKPCYLEEELKYSASQRERCLLLADDMGTAYPGTACFANDKGMLLVHPPRKACEDLLIALTAIFRVCAAAGEKGLISGELARKIALKAAAAAVANARKTAEDFRVHPPHTPAVANFLCK